MEALSPIGETVMDTSVLPSPRSSHLMMGMGEEAMETLTMSPKAPETQEINNERLQQIPAPVLSTDGTLHSLNTSFAGSLSNLVLPGIPNAAAATTSFFLNATSPTTVAAPFLLNQSNLTTATAGAPQFLMNGSAGMQPNTTFFLNTNAGNPNMQTFLLNPNMGGQGTPLMVQTPQTNTAFFVNPGMLNTSPSTLLLTHPGLAGSNGALMLTANQGAAAVPHMHPTMTAAPAENIVDASASEVQVQQHTNDASTLQLRTLQLPMGTLPGTFIQTDGAQNLFLQQRVEHADSDTSSVSELSQGIVEENSLMENIRENKDMLALRLKLRRPREELVSQGIMPPLKATTPAFHEQRQRLERAKVGDSLQRKMRMRPDKAQLVHQHILEDTNMEPMVSATHQRLKRARIEQDLDCKIKNRPGPLELIEGNILKAEHFVEQAVKDGKVKFLKTHEMDTCDDSPYNFDEDSQEGGSDEPMSPPQLYSQQSDNPPSSVGSIPSPPDFNSYYEHHMIPQSITSSSPIQITIPSTPPATMSMITIKQEPGVTSPPPIVSMANTVTSSSPSSSKSGSSSSSSSKNARKKQTKRNKPKEIKFHEYKPPNEQANKLAIPPNASNPYNLLLMQQQLLLQLQLLQQQHHQLILPNAPNMSTTSSKLSCNNPGSQSPSSTTVTSSSSPTPQDNKSSVANCTKTRILSNLEDMKVSELKMELKNRGLHVSGTKPQLVERLRPYADVSMSPVASANSSNQDVTSSSTCTGAGGTKVTSSTDAGQEVASETSSARASMSSPPVSPPDFKCPVSVAASELSDPASPGSAFDPMSPSTFQIAPPPSVNANPSSVLSASSPPNPFSPNPEVQQKQHQTNVQLLNSFQNQTFQMELNESNSVMEQMMDMSAQLAYSDSGVSSDILRKQQQKIEELQRALRLSQLQLQQHQTNFLQSPTLSPPPAPPPPPRHVPTVGAPGVSPKSGSPIKLASINPPPPPPPISLPSTSVSPSTSISTAIQPPPPPITAVHIKAQSPPKQSSPPVFQPPDFAQSLNHQQRTFTFTTPPPNGQPFLFSKATPDVKPPVSLTNGLLPGQKSSSLPSSPTDPEAILGIGGGASLPSYSSPPPNYEEAVRQTQERKAHLGSLLNPTNTETGEPRITKSQDLDDLLEVLVDHGYQIPVTPKNKDVINLSHTRLPPHISLPSFTMATTSSSSNSMLTQAGMSNSTTTGHQGMPQSQMSHPPHPPPPHPQQQEQHQHHPSAATPIAIPQSSSAPSPSPMELPMDVDSADMTLNALDIGKSQLNISKEQHLVSSVAMDDKDNANILSFDIPNMPVDGERESSTFWAFGDHPSPSAGMLCPPSSSDADMNWLDVMMSSSGSGLTPVSVTPPTSIGAEGSLGTPLGKETFSLNLFDLNDDAWENIHVTD